MQSDLFHRKVTLRVSGVTAPIIRSTKNCNHSLGTGHNIGTATSKVARSGLVCAVK